MATETVGTQAPRSTERAAISAKTLRTDRWWLLPLVTFVGFTAFIVYSTWAAFDHHNYYANPYLSPFYSPCLAKSCPSDVAWAHWNIGNWISPALLVLVFPEGLLPVVLVLTAGLRGSRAAQEVLGRDALSAAGAEPAPIRVVLRSDLLDHLEL